MSINQFSDKKLIKYLVLLVVFYTLLTIIQDSLHHSSYWFTLDNLTFFTTWVVAKIYQLLGDSANVFQLYQGYQIGVEGRCVAYVGYTCSGWGVIVTAMSLYLASSALFSFPKALLGLGKSILTIIVLNILRVFALSLLYQVKPSWVEFNHKFTFLLIVYGYVLLQYFVFFKRNIQKQKKSPIHV